MKRIGKTFNSWQKQQNAWHKNAYCLTSGFFIPKNIKKNTGYYTHVVINEKEIKNGEVSKEILLIKLEQMYLGLKDCIEMEYEQRTDRKD